MISTALLNQQLLDMFHSISTLGTEGLTSSINVVRAAMTVDTMQKRYQE